MAPGNQSDQFDRLPATPAQRVVDGRPTRAAVRSWLADRFGIDPSVFESCTFWERGAGKIWLFEGELSSPVDIEAMGMLALRTRQEHWKPTLEFAQRFGAHATQNCIHLTREQAERFISGEDQALDWDGDWGYLIVTHELAGTTEPIGVGLFVHGELRSMVPKGRRRDLS